MPNTNTDAHRVVPLGNCPVKMIYDICSVLILDEDRVGIRCIVLLNIRISPVASAVFGFRRFSF
jgi:hypothetical protein